MPLGKCSEIKNGYNKRNDKCESKFGLKGEEIQLVDKIKYLGYIFSK